MRARELAIGRVPCLALRVTYVGELGWELYCRAEFGLALWDTIWEAGREHGLVAGGYKAIDSLRLEKGYRVWGADITPEDTPFEAGLGFAVKLDKGDVHRPRRARSTRGEPERLLRCLTLDDPRAVALGSEPVRVGGELVGRVTSGGYGYTVERSIAYAYLPGRARRRHGGRGRDLRRVGGGRRRRRAALRSARRADPRVSDFAAEVERVWPGRERARSRCSAAASRTTTSRSRSTARRSCCAWRERTRSCSGSTARVELAATEAAAALGIGPEVVAFVEPEGWLVTRFVEGEIPPLERMREPEMLARVAAALRAFHDGPAIPGALRLLPRRRDLPGDRARPRRAASRRRTSGRTRSPARIEATRSPTRAGAVPQRPPERELPRRRRASAHRRLGVRGHGRSLLRPRELLDQPRARRGRRARRCSRPTSARSASRTRRRSSSCASCPTSARRCGASCSRPSPSSTSTSTRTRPSTSSGSRRTAETPAFVAALRPERRRAPRGAPRERDRGRRASVGSVGSSNCAELLLLQPLELLLRAHADRALEPVLGGQRPTSRRRRGRCRRTRGSCSSSSSQSKPLVPREADRVQREDEEDRDEDDPDDRDRVDPLVVPAEGPRPRLVPAVAQPQAEDHREDERDVEADDRDRRADVVADEEVVERREHQHRREERRSPTTDQARDAVPRDAPPELVARHGAVAREREHHPRRGRRRRREAEELRDDADEEQERPPALAHRRRPRSQGRCRASMLSSAPWAGIANVTARRRIQPKKTETTTDVHMPTAAERDALCVSSAMCADASKPVIVYWAISRPSPKTYQNDDARERRCVPPPQPGVVDRLREDVRERLVLVGDDDQDDDDDHDPDHVPVRGDRVQHRRDP